MAVMAPRQSLRLSPLRSSEDRLPAEADVPRAELLRQDLVCIADELHHEVKRGAVNKAVWRAIETIRSLRITNA